jgi:hypothetical protein
MRSIPAWSTTTAGNHIESHTQTIESCLKLIFGGVLITQPLPAKKIALSRPIYGSSGLITRPQAEIVRRSCPVLETLPDKKRTQFVDGSRVPIQRREESRPADVKSDRSGLKIFGDPLVLSQKARLLCAQANVSPGLLDVFPAKQREKLPILMDLR